MKRNTMIVITALICLTLGACTYNPVEYEKQRERDFNDHLLQNGDGE